MHDSVYLLRNRLEAQSQVRRMLRNIEMLLLQVYSELVNTLTDAKTTNANHTTFTASCIINVKWFDSLAHHFARTTAECGE